MTLGPTHVALEAFLVWVGMGKKNRELFKSHRWLFVLLSSFALFPDMDTFVYIHRTYFHSIFWPLLLIIGILIWLIVSKYIVKKPLSDKLQLLNKSLIIIGAFIILHDILDLTTGPVLLFYPFDNRLYNLDVYMIWDLDFPLIFKGLKFDWSSVSFTEGIDTFFLNLTPKERIEYFGSEFIYIFIGDFPLHLFLFIAWLVFFPGIALLDSLEKLKKSQKLFQRIKLFKSPLLALGVILLTFGIILGPAFGLQRVETRENTNWLYFNQNEANYAITRNFELDKNDSLIVSGDFAGNNSNVDIYAVIANEQQYNNFTSSLSNLFDDYNANSSLTYTWLLSNYQSTIDNLLVSSIDHYLIFPNNTYKMTYTLPNNMVVYSLLLLYQWNSTIDLEVQAQITNVLIIKRPFEFYSGITTIVIGSLLIASSIILTIVSQKRLKESTEENNENQEKLTN
ncbi:MAG: metal-dependent hydrolase [Candidatus Thorarchaeota archaeon]